MASGFKVGGTDLDAIFKARTSTKRANVGLQVATVDISNRYEPSTGGDQIGFNTNYQAAGADLKTLFRNIAYSAGAALSATVDNANLNASGTGTGPFTTGNATITPAGGTAPYTYSWARVSGDATINISNATAQAVNFNATGTTGTSKAALWRCTVRDNVAATVTVDVNVNITFNASALSVNVTPGGGSNSQTGPGTLSLGPFTATPTGGVAPFTYLWSRTGGSPQPTLSSTNTQGTSVICNGGAGFTYSSQWQCKVTDNVGTVAFSNTVNTVFIFN